MSKMEKRILLALLAAFLLLGAAALAISSMKPEPERVAGQFEPPAFEENALAGTPEASGRYGTLKLNEKIEVSMCSDPVISDQGAQVWFTAAAGNAGWVRLRLLDGQEEALGETGLLRPGEYVEYVPMNRQPADGEKIFARILTYEPDTYYSMGSAAAELAWRKAE